MTEPRKLPSHLYRGADGKWHYEVPRRRPVCQVIWRSHLDSPHHPQGAVIHCDCATARGATVHGGWICWDCGAICAIHCLDPCRLVQAPALLRVGRRGARGWIRGRCGELGASTRSSRDIGQIKNAYINAYTGSLNRGG